MGASPPPASKPRMNKSLMYLLFPLFIFLVHITILGLVVFFSIRGKKLGILIINLLAYPLIISFLVAASLLSLSGSSLKSGIILSGCVWGVVGYYSSLLFSFAPLFGPFFREPDLEFFLLGMGTVIGVSFSHPLHPLKGIGPFLARHSLPLLLTVLGTLLLSTTVRILFKHTLSSPAPDKHGALKDMAWIASISAGMIGVPLVYLFQSIRIGG